MSHSPSTTADPLDLQAMRHLVAPFARPGIRVHAETSKPYARTGASRLGGLPDGGPTFRWPGRARPLTFLLQLNLADLPRDPRLPTFPASGLLSFFYDTVRMPWRGRRGSAWDVVFTPADVPVAPLVSRPGGLSTKRILAPRALGFSLIDTLPAECPLGPEARRQFTPGDDDDHGWGDGPVDDLYARLLPPHSWTHQLFGFPQYIQRDAFGVHEPWSTWASLLQLDSDPDLDLMWEDAGKLHWHIPADALAAGRFDSIGFELQCC